MAGTSLNVREREVLDFERTWWTEDRVETKAEAIRRRLRISATRYYELLDSLCDSSAALDYDPLVVRRLRRRRTARRRTRFEGPGTDWRSGNR